MQVLNQGSKNRRLKKWLTAGGVVFAVGGGLWWWNQQPKGPPPMRFETVPVKMGNLTETVTATGTLSPVDAVELGAEVTGRLVKVNVDVNDRVEAGQVLAEIDPEQLRARVQESRAQLTSALANDEGAKASLAEAELNSRRIEALFERGLASAQEVETTHAVLARAKASVSSARAQISLARAGLASTESSQSKAIIIAPIDGVVLARSVEPGQTVTAGFQTPVLFTLARDLTQLDLNVEVDEADIGKVKQGQVATFVVDAYPGRSFESKLVKLHNLPTSAESTVVTYAAVLSVKNDELLLRPGMTATATITTRVVEDALLVPNIALRFEPPRPKTDEGPSILQIFQGRRRGGPPSNRERDPVEASSESIFLDKGGAQRVAVSITSSDGISSAIEPKEPNAIAPGDAAIVSVAAEPQP